MRKLALIVVAVCIPLGAAGGELPANRWVKVNIDFKKTLTDFLAGRKGRWSTTDGYSDNVYRSKTGNVLIRTGIYCNELGTSPGFYTNTTVEWDVKTDTARVHEVANWSGGSYGGGKPLPAYKEHPTPTPRHTYDGICYVPEEDAMYLLFGAYGRMKGGKNPSPEGRKLIEADADYTWKFSFETKRWTRIDNSPRSIKLRIRSLYENHLAHWPEGKKLLFFDSGGSTHAEFDLATQKWSASAAKNRPGMSLYHARSTWDTKRGLWVFRLGPQVCTFDPKEKKFEKLPNCWDMKIPTREELSQMKKQKKKADKRLRWKGICYVAKHDAYLVSGPTGNQTAVYHVAEKKWRSLKAGAEELKNAYCQYNPELDLVLMGHQLDCWKLKYAPQNVKSEGP
ncbi:MAG: hypothetical protein ACYTGB_02015 [Planctomycetota bacterium]|jgi:hypothetical protein